MLRGCWAGTGLRQDVACAAEKRTASVTSVTPGRRGLSTSRQGCMGCVTQTGGWLELKGEVLSSEEHWLRAMSPSSLLPPPKLPPLPPPSPPPRYSWVLPMLPTARRGDVCLCVCVPVLECSFPLGWGLCVYLCVCACVSVCLEWCLPLSSVWHQYTQRVSLGLGNIVCMCVCGMGGGNRGGVCY